MGVLFTGCTSLPSFQFVSIIEPKWKCASSWSRFYRVFFFTFRVRLDWIDWSGSWLANAPVPTFFFFLGADFHSVWRLISLLYFVFTHHTSRLFLCCLVENWFAPRTRRPPWLQSRFENENLLNETVTCFSFCWHPTKFDTCVRQAKEVSSKNLYTLGLWTNNWFHWKRR